MNIKITCYRCKKQISNIDFQCECTSTLQYRSGNVSIYIDVDGVFYELYYLIEEKILELTVETGDFNIIYCNNYNPINKSEKQLTDFILKQLKLRVLQ